MSTDNPQVPSLIMRGELSGEEITLLGPLEIARRVIADGAAMSMRNNAQAARLFDQGAKFYLQGVEAVNARQDQLQQAAIAIAESRIKAIFAEAEAIAALKDAEIQKTRYEALCREVPDIMVALPSLVNLVSLFAAKKTIPKAGQAAQLLFDALGPEGARAYLQKSLAAIDKIEARNQRTREGAEQAVSGGASPAGAANAGTKESKEEDPE